MRIVRIDKIAPGGAALEVHPRLTVLRGASPELRRRFLETLRAVADGGAPSESGVIEVSGVQLALDATTIAQLRLDGAVDPVLSLSGHGIAASAPTSGPTSPGSPRGTTPDAVSFADNLPPPVEVVSDDEADLRAQLREVTSARTELGLRMDAARSGLDSFSTAALEVCLGQIDALEMRRASLRVDWERERDEQRSQVAVASAQLAAVRSLVDRVSGVVASEAGARAASARLAATVAPGAEPDPTARRHAAQLDAAAARVRELTEQRDEVQTRVGQMAAELDHARAEADDAQLNARATPVDRSVIQRLEAVRDEIFTVDERQSVLGAARNKRRVMELRSEEAILLDRMGFDTYSAYVMGIPTVRAELDRASRAEAAMQRIAELESELERLVEVDSPRVLAARSEAAAQLHRLLLEAVELLGDDGGAAPSPVPAAGELPEPEQLADEVHSGQAAASLVHRISVALWDRRLIDDNDLDGALADATQILTQADALAASLPGVGPDGPVPIPDLPDLPVLPPPPVPQGDRSPAERAAERGQLQAALDHWIGWLEQLARWITSTESVIVELEHLVAGRSDGDDSERVERWAQVEAELDDALDRLALAQERVRSHEEATAALAELRTEELELRDRERDLLAKISNVEVATVPPTPPDPTPPVPIPPDPTPPVAPGTPTPPSPSAPPSATGVAADPTTAEWVLISHLARQRSLSFVGSLPLAVDGLPEDPAALDRVLARLDRMSDVVQVVVLSDDDAVAAWATGLGGRGRIVGV